MDSNQTPTIATLTRELIRSKIVDLSAREQTLVRQAQAVYANGSGMGAAPPSQEVQQRHDRARQLLNGAGAALMPQTKSGDDTDAGIHAELGAVRLALDVLSRASVEREAIEAATWAIENGPAWRAKVHKLVVAMAALLEADAEATAFVDAAGGGRADALPHMGIYRSYGGIDIAGWTTLKGVFDLAVDEGVAKATELKGARNAR